jgi:hypothetical protein
MDLKSSATALNRLSTLAGSTRATLVGLCRILASGGASLKIFYSPCSPSSSFLLKYLRVFLLCLVDFLSPIWITKISAMSCSVTLITIHTGKGSTFPAIRRKKFILLKKRNVVFFFERFSIRHFYTATHRSFLTRLRGLIPHFFLNHKSNPLKPFFRRGFNFFNTLVYLGYTDFNRYGRLFFRFDSDRSNPV